MPILDPPHDINALNEFAFTVDPESHGIRIDRFLVRQLRNYTPFRMQRMIVAGATGVDGDVVPLIKRVRRDERVTIRLIEPPDKVLEPEPLPVEILFEDDAIIVVDKPAGQIAHPVARYQTGTLCNALQWHLDRQTPLRGILRPGIVHRLDRMTSGVMIVAKTFRAHRGLSMQFQENRIRKEYLAIVEGPVERDSGTIDSPIGQIPGGQSILMTTAPDARNPKPARTDYEIVERFAETTLIRLKPHTGRIHQIRVHLASIGHPVVRDEFYGAFGEIRAERRSSSQGHDENTANDSRHMLHASHLSFHHPESDEPMTVDAVLPDTWTTL